MPVFSTKCSWPRAKIIYILTKNNNNTLIKNIIASKGENTVSYITIQLYPTTKSTFN